MSKNDLDAIIEKNKRKKRRKERRRIKTYRIIYEFFRATLGARLIKKFNVHPENLELFEELDPPYFLISNHNSFWGPFMMAYFVPIPVSYVVSDANFRSLFVRIFLGFVAAIPKTKVISDLDTIKHIMEIKQRNGVIGLFPEGQNSYDGHSQPIYYSTAKLLRRSNIPVVFADKKGTYLTFPRWAKKSRKGEVSISYRLVFTPEELKTLPVEAIYQKLVTLIDYDAFETQKERMVSFKGKDLAEYLEIVLFVCPDCRSLASLVSKGDILTCTRCGYAVRYTELCFFEPVKGELHFRDIRQWNVWQIEYINTLVSEKITDQNDEPVFQEKEIRLGTGYKSEPMKPAGKGMLSLYSDRLRFLPRENREMAFFLNKIEGLNMHNEEKLEFYYDDTLFRFDSEHVRVSLYKWYIFIQAVKSFNKPV